MENNIPPQNGSTQNITQVPSGRSIGPIVGSLIIVVLLIIAALYISGQKLNNDERQRAVEESYYATTTPETADLQADLNMDFNSLEESNF